MMDESEDPSNDHGEDHQLEVQQGDERRQEWWLEEENHRYSLQRAAIKKKYPNMTPSTFTVTHLIRQKSTYVTHHELSKLSLNRTERLTNSRRPLTAQSNQPTIDQRL